VSPLRLCAAVGVYTKLRTPQDCAQRNYIRLHPCSGGNVFVPRGEQAADSSRLRCTFDELESRGIWKFPPWMFDRAACVRTATSRRTLSVWKRSTLYPLLLNQVLKMSRLIELSSVQVMWKLLRNRIGEKRMTEIQRRHDRKSGTKRRIAARSWICCKRGSRDAKLVDLRTSARVADG